MAYVPAMYVAVWLILCDLFFTAIRSTMHSGGDVATYVLLSLHEIVAVSEGVIIFAFFSYTVWFTAGLLGHLSFTLRGTLPAILLRLILIQMPVIYAKFLSSKSRWWDDPVYGVLFCLDIVSCIILSASLMFTVACLSEKRMYAPYHLNWRPAAMPDSDGAARAMMQRANRGGVANTAVSMMMGASGAGALAVSSTMQRGGATPQAGYAGAALINPQSIFPAPPPAAPSVVPGSIPAISVS